MPSDSSILYIAGLSLVLNGVLAFILFYRFSIRASQYFSLVGLFSFAVRPLATATCDTFQPFYYFEPGLYEQGVLLGNAALTLYNFGLLLAGRRGTTVRRFDFGELTLFSNFALIVALVIDLAALQVFGAAILPGVRTTGLQQAAAGSQIYFAFVSALTVVGFATAVACMIVRPAGHSMLGSVIRIVGFFAISMFFYQRGALLLGGVFGLVIAATHNPRFYSSSIAPTVAIFVAFAVVATFGRPLITAVVATVEPQAQVELQAAPTVKQQPSCRIANVANQEHDQVWPTIITFVDRFEPDYFKNIAAALLRPFLSADARDRLGLTTSSDSLNLYNDARTYLDLNFGFSIASSQYYYFSLGGFFLVAVFLAGLLSSLAENRTAGEAGIVDTAFLRRAVLVLNLVYLLASPIDEQLKWAAVNIVTAYCLIGGFRFLRRMGRRGPSPGSGALARRGG